MGILRSIRFRLTLWYVVLLAVILAAFSGGIYLVVRQSLYSNLDDTLENRAIVLTGVLTYDSGRPTLAGVNFPGDPAEGEDFARVFDSRGEVTFDNSAPAGGVPVDEAAVERALAGQASVRTARVGDEKIRVRTVPVRRGGETSGAVEVGLSQDDVDEALRILLVAIVAAYPLTLLVASFGGMFLAGRALSPMDRLTRLARRITAEDLSQRLDMNLPDDEMGRLARTFDEMIARLDEAFRRQRRFTADASHELRTPLTVIKGQTEVTLQRERSPEAYRQVLRAVNDEVDRMIRLVGSLLTLARADAGQIPLTLERVDLCQVANAAVEQIRPSAEQKGLRLDVDCPGEIVLRADEDLLLQLLLNLLDNAVKYTPSGGEVSLSCGLYEDATVLIVRDTGIGIPAEHLPHVFDRFYRVDKARSRSEGGAGLGLSISDWIAAAHGGSISVESKPGQGSTFTVRLPAR